MGDGKKRVISPRSSPRSLPPQFPCEFCSQNWYIESLYRGRSEVGGGFFLLSPANFRVSDFLMEMFDTLDGEVKFFHVWTESH